MRQHDVLPQFVPLQVAETIVRESVIYEHPTHALDRFVFLPSPLSEEYIDKLAEGNEVKKDRIIDCLQKVEACITERLSRGELGHLNKTDAFKRLSRESLSEMGDEICDIVLNSGLAEGRSLKDRTTQNIQMSLQVMQLTQIHGLGPPDGR